MDYFRGEPKAGAGLYDPQLTVRLTTGEVHRHHGGSDDPEPWSDPEILIYQVSYAVGPAGQLEVWTHAVSQQTDDDAPPPQLAIVYGPAGWVSFQPTGSRVS